MADHNDLGASGEEMAKAYLAEKGFQILESNWRSGKNEIDIIAIHNDTLVVAEVKTRSSSLFGEPEVFVNKNKQRMLIRAANIYVQRNNIDLEVRFDIVSVISGSGKHKVHHIIDAFYPTL